MDEGLKVNNGDTLGKTIIFARDHNHAIMIQEEFRKLYPELCLSNNPNGVDYCVVIDNQIKYNEVLQREFKEKQNIRIVVSVDMMDTGVDIPEVVNLVFFKKVLSKIKFWQMIGRGARLCQNLNVLSPSKAYFGRMTNDGTRQLYQDKQGFLIFDICNVFPFFKENPDGKDDKSDIALSLYQKVFLEKATLYRAMLANYAKLQIEDKKYCDQIRNELIQEVKGMNTNYIGVQSSLKYVNKYSEIVNWINFDQTNLAEVKKYIAPNVTGEIDLESARKFDFMCYKFAATRFYNNADFKNVAKMLFVLSQYLIQYKSHIKEVSDHLTTLNYMGTDEFINDSTICKVDSVRCEIRDLIRFIEKKVFEPLITDFTDNIESTGDAIEDPVDMRITIDDFKTLEEKARFFIQNNVGEPLVKEIQDFIKPTSESISLFKSKMIKIAKTADEYNELFSNDEDLVIFVRKNIEISPIAITSFVELLRNNGFNDSQIKYAKELLVFISQNGTFKRQDLLREELDFDDIFDSVQINKLLALIEERV